jgi:hypothetical protein
MATDDPKHQQALDRFKLVVLTEADQREREVEDLNFYAGDQWPSDVKTQRAGLPAQSSQSAQPVPARPMLVIRSLDQPIAQVINQARNARMAIKVAPKSGGAVRETADVFQGLCRAIEYESQAQTAYLWAYQRAVICGRGYFRIVTDWATEDTSSWDQVLKIQLILNGGSVYLDPWAQNLNDPGSVQWGFITEDVSEERYKREYGATKLATADGASDLDLQTVGDPKDAWVKVGENGERTYRIAEYFFLEYDETTETDPDDPKRKRSLRTPRLMWGKLNGIEWIEEPQEQDGKYIPIVPVLGSELNISGLRRWEGMVRPVADSCRILNYEVTALVEASALAPKAPFLGYRGQFEGVEDKWLSANTRNQPYLEANAVTDATGTQILPLPERNSVEPPIQAMTQAVALFTNFIRSTTGVPDAALGHVNPNDRSGKAIAQLQQASEQGTSNFPDNLQRAIQHGGLILVDKIPHVYDRPGRIAHILTGQDDQQQVVMLNQPFVQTPQGPQAQLPGQPPAMMPLPNGQHAPRPVQHFDLSKGQYSVVVEVGKSFATRREEANESLGQLAQAAPELVPKFADLWVKNMDIPESEAIAERLAPPDQDGGLPPQVQQAIQQLQAENQQLKQLVQGRQAEKQVEQDAKLLEAAMDNETKIEIAKIQAGASLSVADIKAGIDSMKVSAEQLRTVVEAAEERRMQAHDSAHDVGLQAHQHAHERGMAAQQHENAMRQQAAGHDQAMAQGMAGHAQALEQGDQAHQQATDQAMTNAALQPQPQEPAEAE